jgi:hypothetical protein
MATAFLRQPWRTIVTKHKYAAFSMLLPLLIAAGCTTMGTGFGSTATGTNPVHFNWKSFDGVSGTMYATLADGSVYAGSYFQITSNTTVDTLGPLWDGWGAGWGFGGWDDWDTGSDFVTHYSGRVVANLADPEGKHIRCKFQLVSPSSGMSGGGEGDCQLPDGKTIVTSFRGASADGLAESRL